MTRNAVFVAASLGAGAIFAAYVIDAGADETRHRIDMSRVIDAGPQPEFTVTKTPPDPPPLVEQRQWVFDLRWARGDVWLLGVHKIALGTPQATPRAIGRFALELFEGPVLIERVRFDFPMLAGVEGGDAGSDTQLESPFSFSRNLRTRIGVIFPATDRGTRLELWDRATDRRWALPWPADAPLETWQPANPDPSSFPWQRSPASTGSAVGEGVDGGRPGGPPEQ